MQLGSSPAERLYSPILPLAPYILALRLLPPLFCSPILVPSLYFLTHHLCLTKPVPHTGKQHDYLNTNVESFHVAINEPQFYYMIQIIFPNSKLQCYWIGQHTGKLGNNRISVDSDRWCG